MTPILEARSLSLKHRLATTDLSIAGGQLVAIIGPNGSGKTSLLRALGGVEHTSGTVSIGGETLLEAPSQRRPALATFLPASREIIWPINVRDVIALGLPNSNVSRVDELIELLELQSLALRPIDRLSTGERARVLLARALAPRPRVLLLDEPLSNLDPYWVLRIFEILRQAVTEGSSALVSLHDIDRVVAFDRVLLMSEGELRADLAPLEMLGSKILAEAFRIERESAGWRIKPREDRRSSL
jgi:iron complex transport system ATP-binding protein